jgi:hypothetical protein
MKKSSFVPSSILSQFYTLAILVVAAISVGACEDNPVGRICDLGGAAQSSQSLIASPSLDCVSRQCLQFPQEVTSLPPGSKIPPTGSGLCTAECSADSDCDRVPESPCKTGFTCAIATVAGAYCCKKFCVCKDYIVLPQLAKEACNPANPLAKCKNLAGR